MPQKVALDSHPMWRTVSSCTSCTGQDLFDHPQDSEEDYEHENRTVLHIFHVFFFFFAHNACIGRLGSRVKQKKRRQGVTTKLCREWACYRLSCCAPAFYRALLRGASRVPAELVGYGEASRSMKAFGRRSVCVVGKANTSVSINWYVWVQYVLFAFFILIFVCFVLSSLFFLFVFVHLFLCFHSCAFVFVFFLNLYLLRAST